MFTVSNENTFNCIKVFIKILTVATLFATASANASDTQFTGFVSLGLTHAPSDEFQFRTSLINQAREGLSWQADTLVGLQVNTRLDDKFDFVGQLILQDRADDAFTNLLELAFIRYQMNRNWSMQAGRFSTNSYLLTDYRYVRHAQYWVRPPLEMYSPTGSLGNMNGVQLNYVADFSVGTLKLSGALGRNDFQNDSERSKLRITYQDLATLAIEFQAMDWRIQASHLTAVLDELTFEGVDEVRSLGFTVPTIFRPFALEIQRTFLPEGARVSYSSIGGMYQEGAVELIAEVADYKSDWALSQSSKQGYVSLAYNIGDFTPFITAAYTNRDKVPQVIDYERAEASLPPFLFQQLTALTQEADDTLRSASIDQDSISLGLRWSFSFDWAVKVQLDHNRMNESGSGLFSLVGDLSAPREKRRYNVLNISFTTTF